MRFYYAQNKEDLFIKAFFPNVKNGFYIDVGANDPIVDSVTKLLYDDGWHGVNIDPIKRHVDNLSRLRPRDTNLQIGISSKAGTLKFTEYPEGDGLSTFDASMQKYYQKEEHPFPTEKAQSYDVQVKTLRQVVDEIKPAHIHFIKIDVEGYEYEVISGYDWKSPRPELICIEANHIQKDWRNVLKDNKYEEVFFDGVNNYYLAQESLHRKDYFNYPDTVFAGNPVYYPAYVETVAPLEKIIADKEAEIAQLHRQQRDVRFLAKRLAIETQTRLNKRAKGVYVTSHLTYQKDATVDTMLEGQPQSKEGFLAEIHKVDVRNIRKQQTTAKDRLKPIVWKVAAGTFNTGLRTAKRVKRGG